MEAWLQNDEWLIPSDATSDITKQCIYKVPEWLKDGISDTAAYTPEIVSFGPYHWKTPSLAEMDKHKLRRLSRNSPQRVAEFLVEMGKILPQVRLCYETDPLETVSDNEFKKMLVLDGCFMLDYLRALWSGGGGEMNNDPVFSMMTKMEVIGRDLIKLENQLPIIVLQTLLNVQYPGRCDEFDLPHMVLNALNPIWVTSEAENIRVMKNLHCLDIFRSSMLYDPSLAFTMNPSDAVTSNKLLYESIRTNSVEDLVAAGVNFKMRNKKPFWDIRFDNRRGVLQLPPIRINKTSETMFLNLIAYEQCHFKSFQEMTITDYVSFMNTLINTGDDVARLHKAGIMVHQLGNDDEVADLFNGLVMKVYVAPSVGRLRNVYKELNEYCSMMRHVWYADYRHEYLKNPWVMISMVAAVILFFLTVFSFPLSFIQTVYTVKPPR